MRQALILLLLPAFASCTRPVPPSPSCQLAIQGPVGEVGFDADVTLRGTELCDGRPTFRPVTWSTGQVATEVRLHTPSAVDRLVLRERPAILPVSAAQAWLTIRASTDHASAEHDLLLAHRHSGLPSTPIGVAVYVFGGPGGSVQKFVPGEPGSATITDPRTGFTATLHAGRPDDLPLDCGRSDCHPSEARRHALTAMSSTYARALWTPPRAHDPRCLQCHAALADPGIPGGFLDIANAVGFFPIPHRSMIWDEVPRAVRRLANVGCVACHGTGQIPDAADRPLAYGSGVCAQCHDAPPRYAAVAEWRGTRMAELVEATTLPSCAGCHTAQGFVQRLRGVAVDVNSLTAEPVTCAACHDPHGPGSDNPRLVRLGQNAAGSSEICSMCHRADVGKRPEERFQARLAPMAPAAELAPATCLDCHRPHAFRFRASHTISAADEQRAQSIARRLSAAFARLEALLPRQRGCNAKAGMPSRFAVVADRIAVVDARGVALGDCDGDGRFDREDPMISPALASKLYRRVYELMIVGRDKSRGLHDPARAEQIIARAVEGL